MSCVNRSNRLDRCGNPQPTNCIKYVGDEFDCIELCSNISLTDIIEKLAQSICDIKEEINLDDLIIPNCFTIPEVTFISVLTALLNRTCDLQSQIDAINLLLSDFNPIIADLNMGCLTDNPCFTGNPTLKEILTLLISEVCNLNTDVNKLEALISIKDLQIQTLQNQVNSLTTTVTCLNTKFNNLTSYLNNTVFPLIPVGSYTPTC